MTSGTLPPDTSPWCTRLLCATRWPGPGSAMDALLARRAEALARAAECGVRGASLHTSGWLVQWLEGPRQAVKTAWAQLREGSAGRHPILLHDSQGPAGLPEPVQLASLYTGGSGTEVARRLHSLARQHEERWTAEPLETWQALSAPCLRSDPVSVERVGRRQVLVLGARDQEAIDLVRDVAHGASARVAYQRHAGSDARRADVGAAYTDLPASPATVLRLHAVSRAALCAGAPLLGVGVPEHAVLLLGTDPARAQALLRDATQWLHQVRGRPVLHLVSPHQAIVDAATHAVTALGPHPRLQLAAGTSARATAVALLSSLARPGPRGTVPSPTPPAAGGRCGSRPMAAAC